MKLIVNDVYRPNLPGFTRMAVSNVIANMQLSRVSLLVLMMHPPVKRLDSIHGPSRKGKI